MRKKTYQHPAIKIVNIVCNAILNNSDISDAQNNRKKVVVGTLCYHLNFRKRTATVISGINKHEEHICIPPKIKHNLFSYNVTSIDAKAFEHYLKLKSISIPESITDIGKDAFFGCGSLTSIIVEEENKVFDSRDNCNAIIETNNNTLILGCNTTVVPKNVTTISDYAFFDCSGLKSIVIPESVTSIGRGAFDACYGLKSIVVEKGNKKFDSRNNCNAIIETNNNTLVRGCIITMIPESVTAIGDNAFYGCDGLTSISIPDNVTKIGKNAFYCCFDLTSISISKNLKTIGDNAFAYCDGIKMITIPECVTNIGVGTFEGCRNLKTIFSKIGTPFIIDHSVFDHFQYKTPYSAPTLFVPIGTKKLYAKTASWNDFLNIVEYDYK